MFKGYATPHTDMDGHVGSLHTDSAPSAADTKKSKRLHERRSDLSNKFLSEQRKGTRKQRIEKKKRKTKIIYDMKF